MPKGSLRDVIQNEELTWTQKLNLAIEITRGLQYLHSQTPPVLHRDLKTLNILVDEANHIKLADFGATSAVSEAASSGSLPETPTVGGEQSSSTGTAPVEMSFGGTLYCMAPEVLDHQPYTVASDIYSLGLVFYELACGEIPFDGLSHMQLLRAIEAGSIEPLSSVESTAPASYCSLVSSCISKNPEERPSLDDVMTILKECKGAQS